MVLPDRKRLQYFSWLTILGMSAIGILLISYIQRGDVKQILFGGKAWYLQLTAGLLFGALSSFLAVVFIQGRRFKNVRHFFESLMQELNPSMGDILFYSVCAGVGEEVLFRAGIQPLIGIWPAALLFVFLHGYIHPSNINLTIYGLFLVVICSGFGYLFKFIGLASCITAHIVYDVAMFSMLKYSNKKTAEEVKAV
jgi:membrane protease YdiL (CAAX protease family)